MPFVVVHGMPRAHPRVCGENVLMRETIHPVPGSSPRVRGKPSQRRGSLQAVRLIPACAGKTVRGSVPWQTMGAHPRVCGENFTLIQSLDIDVGSSPRVRGKLEKLSVGH